MRKAIVLTICLTLLSCLNVEAESITGNDANISVQELLFITTKETVVEEVAKTPYFEGIPMTSDIQMFVYEQAEENNIPSSLVFALIETESGYRSNLVSTTNDFGLMQINACNHNRINKHYGYTLNYLDPYDNIRAGMFILRELYDIYGNTQAVLVAYNYGHGGANNLFRKGIYSTKYSNKITSKMKQIESRGTDYRF